MPFVEYTSKRKVPTEANYLRVGNMEIKFSKETFEEMGSPKKVRLYFDATTNRIAIKLSEDGSGTRVNQTSPTSGVYSVFSKGFMTQFSLFLENPINCKLVKEGNMFTCSLKSTDIRG